MMFEVLGPFDVPVTRRRGGRLIRQDDGVKFWRQRTPALARHYGCYVFAVRTGRRIMPLYVGKTARSFEQECFTIRNLLLFNEGLQDYRKGPPVLFLICAPKKKGKRTSKVIGKLETFLIQEAKACNPRLLNKQKVTPHDWGIQGVLRGTAGKPSAAATSFRAMLRL